jgi:hypothetical protein
MRDERRHEGGGAGGPGAFDRDINLKAIAYTVVGLALLVAVSMLLMWWLGQDLKRAEVAADPVPSPIPEAAGRQVPPEPRLQGAPDSAFAERQGSPELELRQMRAEEDQVLDGYGWVDEAAGVARIPVGRAVEILAAHGLPPVVTAPGDAPAAPGPAPSRGGGAAHGGGG